METGKKISLSEVVKSVKRIHCLELQIDLFFYNGLRPIGSLVSLCYSLKDYFLLQFGLCIIILASTQYVCSFLLFAEDTNQSTVQIQKCIPLGINITRNTGGTHDPSI